FHFVSGSVWPEGPDPKAARPGLYWPATISLGVQPLLSVRSGLPTRPCRAGEKDKVTATVLAPTPQPPSLHYPLGRGSRIPSLVGISAYLIPLAWASRPSAKQTISQSTTQPASQPSRQSANQRAVSRSRNSSNLVVSVSSDSRNSGRAAEPAIRSSSGRLVRGQQRHVGSSTHSAKGGCSSALLEFA
ncbi:unnamed protein product, partial [Protopolystoma xenopodis]